VRIGVAAVRGTSGLMLPASPRPTFFKASTTQKSRRDVRVRTAQSQTRDAADHSIITWEADGVVAALPATPCGPTIT
jgi:hypothetical protein